MSLAMFHPPGQQRSFPIPALRRLGGSTGVSYCRHDQRHGGIEEVQSVFVSCPRDAWVREFGQPQNLCQHLDGSCGKWMWSWDHQLPEGRLHCVGQLFQRAASNDWIIVRQLTIYPAKDQTQ